MANRLSLSTDNSGFNFAGFAWALEQGLFSTSAAGTESALFSMDAGTTELYSTSSMGTEFKIDYTMLDGEIHATGVTVYDDGAVLAKATFAQPEPLGFGTWTTAGTTLYDALFGDSRIDFRGGNGDDWANGSDFADRFRLGGGNDMAYGGAGNDKMDGGKGNDFLAGGADNDILLGRGGHDMLIGGPGNDTIKAGAGNDIIILDQDGTTVWGGKGHDVYIQEIPSGATSRTQINDYEPGVDVLVFVGVASTASGTPDGFVGETLADLENGMIDDFVWRDTKKGVQIQAGDAQMLLKGVAAADIDLDLLVFSSHSLAETLGIFSANPGEGVIGTSANGGDMTGTTSSDYLTITMTNTLLEFETYSGDIAGFMSAGTDADPSFF